MSLKSLKKIEIYYWLSKKQWLMTGNPNQKWLKRARNSDQSADIRAMLNDFGVSATLTDMSASTSTTVSGHTGIG